MFVLNYDNPSESIVGSKDYAKLRSLGKGYLSALETNLEENNSDKEALDHLSQEILTCAESFLGQRGQGGVAEAFTSFYMALLHHEHHGVVNHGKNERSKNAVINLDLGIVSYKGKFQGRYNGSAFDSKNCTAAFVLASGLLISGDELESQGVNIKLGEEASSSLHLLMMYSEEVDGISESQLTELISDKKLIAQIKHITTRNNQLFLQLAMDVFLGNKTPYKNKSPVLSESAILTQSMHVTNNQLSQGNASSLPSPKNCNSKEHKINTKARDLAAQLKKEGKILPMPGVQLDNSDTPVSLDRNTAKTDLGLPKNPIR